ncbi:MAG: PH domain-containing protein [Candidatus Dormibacteraeota bacterium]|nr:PH domain-containing protein [Candidatus Dormibacteraeota bacterium]
MSTEMMPGEQRLALVRQHWSVIAAPTAGGVLVLVAGLVALAFIPGTIAGVRLSGVKVAIGVALVIATVVWVLVHYLRWRLLTYLLTDRRIIVEGGVISRYEESISLDRIQNTVLRRPLADRMLGAGEIEIESAGRNGIELMHRIPRAAAFYAALMQAMQNLRSSGPYPPPPAGL